MSSAESKDDDGTPPFIEPDDDAVGTKMAYDPTGKMPFLVTVVWVCALVGLAAYTMTYLFPDLGRWGKP
jgi:hypothetical protein